MEPYILKTMRPICICLTLLTTLQCLAAAQYLKLNTHFPVYFFDNISLYFFNNNDSCLSCNFTNNKARYGSSQASKLSYLDIIGDPGVYFTWPSLKMTFTLAVCTFFYS